MCQLFSFAGKDWLCGRGAKGLEEEPKPGLANSVGWQLWQQRCGHELQVEMHSG